MDFAEHALRLPRVIGEGQARDVADGVDIRQTGVSGDAHDGGAEIVRAIDHPVEGRELVLTDADLTSHRGQIRLNQLLHRRFSTADRDDVE